jgi:Tfp pilus assembly protein PilN
MANINLLPVEYREKEKFNLRRVLIILFVVILAFGSVCFYFSLELKINYKEQELKTMKTELAALEKVIKEVKNLEKDKKVIEERITVIQGLIDNQSRLSRILGEFSNSILDEVWVNNLSLSANQTFNFTANTFNNYLIAKYMVTLKNDPTFDNIELAYVQKSKIKEEDKDIEIVNFKLSGIFMSKMVKEGK